MNGMNDPYKARKKRRITATVLFVAGLLLFAALIVTGFILRERYPALVYAACAITLAYIIASCAILFKVSRRIDEPEAGRAGLPWWAWAGGGVVVAGAAGTAVALSRRKKHAKNALLDDFEWQGDEEGAAGGRG